MSEKTQIEEINRNIYDIKSQKKLTESEKYINFNEYTNTVNSFGNAIYGY